MNQHQVDVPVGRDDLAEAVIEICEKHGLSYTQFAILSGVGPDTARYILLTRRSPKRADPRAKIARFVRANQAATRRSDLRLVDNAA